MNAITTCIGLYPCGGDSVVKDSFTTDGGGNRQGILGSSNGWENGEQRRAAEALEADSEDVKELEAAEKKLLKKPEETI